MITVDSTVRVGLEEASNGFIHVHALSLPGCVASGPTKEIALDRFTGELSRWLSFLSRKGARVPPPESELEVAVDEWVATDADVAAGESLVCFAADRVYLDETEAVVGVQLLGDLRGRLLPHIRRERDARLESIGSPPVTLRTILDELARAQWWTLTRLGASPMAEVPPSVVGRLDTAMALVVQEIVHLSEDARGRVLLLDGEEWTARKVLRRLLWLEWSLGGAALRLLGLTGSTGSSR